MRQEARGILHLDLKLSYACNNNCIHCVIADQRERAKSLGKDYLTTNEVLTELLEARKSGFRVVTFTGGEPTLRRDLPLLVRFARSLGLEVGLQTNARVLALESYREALCGLGVRFVVAIHGAEAAVHDSITRTPGSFGQTLGAMRALTDRGEKVTGKIVISRVNMAQLPAIAALLLESNVMRANFTFPHGLGNAARNYESVVPRLSEVMPYLREALIILEAEGGSVVTEAIPLCVLGPLARVASENYYRERVVSEVRQLDQGPRNWSRDRIVEGKAKGVACARCPLTTQCEGVWKEYIEYYGAHELGLPSCVT